MNVSLTKLRVGDISFDHSYQRPLDEKRAKLIAQELDFERLGAIEVSRRADGSLWAVDGQHRLVALVLVGKVDFRVNCVVHTGLTVPEEAKLFLKLNLGRNAPRNFALYNAELRAEEKEATEIAAILKSLGLRAWPTRAHKSICALSAVRAAHRLGNLRDTLIVLKAWGGGDARMLEGVLVRAISLFFAAYPEADVAQMSDKMRTGARDPLLLVNALTARRHVLRSEKAYVAEIAQIYNRRRKHNRLGEE